MTGDSPNSGSTSGHGRFSTDEAEQLLADQPREHDSLNVTAWANAYGLKHFDDPNPRTIRLIGPTSDGLNREYAMGTDLTKPVLVATLEGGCEPTPLFIDGVHRLYRAWREGVASLPAYVLTRR